jgi:hypothetical protein
MEKRYENNGLDKLSIGFGVSFLIVSVVNALLLIAKENLAPVKAWMASLSGHHWTTHGILVIVLFIAMGYLLSRAGLEKKLDADKISWLVIVGTALGGLIIVGFFFKHLLE